MNLIRSEDHKHIFHPKRSLATITSVNGEKFYIEKGKLEKSCGVVSDIFDTDYSSETISFFLKFLKTKSIENVPDVEEFISISKDFECNIDFIDSLEIEQEIITSFVKKSSLLDILEDVGSNDERLSGFCEMFKNDMFDEFLKSAKIYFEEEPMLYKRLLIKFLLDIPVVDPKLEKHVKDRILSHVEF